MPRDVGVVVVAAGKGERMGGEVPKQFLPLSGAPLLLHAVRPFLSHPAIAEVIVVLPPAMAARPPAWLAELAGERLRIAAGGAERMDSVEAGLGALGGECRVVLVHDGARPFPDPAVIEAVIAAARAGTGAVAGVPLADTVKEARGGTTGPHPSVVRTVSRAGLWRAQTPQGFPRDLFEAAYRSARAAGFTGTDDASLVERIGAPVILVPDVTSNFKVTTRDDLRLAEALAAARR